MENFLKSYLQTKNLHHAYILEGEREAVRKELFDFLENVVQHETRGNPDFWHEIFESFSIEDARNLREKQVTKALSDTKKIFVIETLSMTVEAQNSLLKIFEEPAACTHFFIITPNAEVFLPTLRSRVSIISHGKKNHRKEVEGDPSLSEESKIFFRSSMKDRLELVGEIAEEKDKGRAISLIENIIKKIHTENFSDALQNKNQKISDSKFLLNELIKIRAYLSDRSPSIKLLLEHSALITPKF